MTPIIILLAPENLTDPPQVDLPTPMAVDAHLTFLALKGRATTMDIDTHITMMGVDGNVREMAIDGD